MAFRGVASMKKMQYIRRGLDNECEYYPSLISFRQVSRNPKRVSEAVQESSARINVIVPGHPDSLPGGGRITPIIYVGGGQAELEQWQRAELQFSMVNPQVIKRASRVVILSRRSGVNHPRKIGLEQNHVGVASHLCHTPLREIARFVQGIVLFKESTLYQGFLCN